jgi:hypothetical protein
VARDSHVRLRIGEIAAADFVDAPGVQVRTDLKDPDRSA